MPDLLNRIWENLAERTGGPMNLRFFLQPAMAIFFAIREGVSDAKNNRVPYLWKFATSKGDRKNIVKEGWKDFGKVFIIATILDIVYQLFVIYRAKTENRFYPLESLIIAFALSVIPYILFRGPVSRLVRMFVRKNKSEQT